MPDVVKNIVGRNLLFNLKNFLNYEKEWIFSRMDLCYFCFGFSLHFRLCVSLKTFDYAYTYYKTNEFSVSK